jgi:lambda repressor-like predicted transcriptional regulator
MNITEDKAVMVLQLLVEGNSMRSTSRITGVDPNTVMKILVLAGERCERLMAEQVQGVEVDEVQVDEIWGFVGMKEKRRPADREDLGDAWAFVAFERKTKMVLCYHLGKRNDGRHADFYGSVSGSDSRKFSNHRRWVRLTLR